MNELHKLKTVYNHNSSPFKTEKSIYTQTIPKYQLT